MVGPRLAQLRFIPLPLGLPSGPVQMGGATARASKRWPGTRARARRTVSTSATVSPR